MSEGRQKTLQTYEQSAGALAEYFKGIGARVDDIERALALAEIKDGSAKVVELGCGDGRDAREIVKRAGWYQGVDSSGEMIRIARQNASGNTARRGFWVFDMLEYEFPDDLDAVFAFASLLHLNRDEVANVSNKVAKALRPGGIFYISLKYRPEYSEEIKVDEFGSRQFFYYSPEVISELAGPFFEDVYQDFQTIGQTEWFTVALKKLDNEN